MTLLLLMRRAKPPEPRTRTRFGIRNVIYRAIPKGERVTLAQAIDILRAGW